MEEGFFEGPGPRIHWQAHRVSGSRAAVAIVHGYGEHAGRYLELVQALGNGGFDCFLLDLRGHGLSEGPRGHVDRFEDYLFDLDRLVEKARGASERLFLFGHSLGGLILLRYLQEGGEADGAIVSAPYLKLAFEPPAWKRKAATILERFFPRLPIPSGLRPEMLTRDPERRAEAEADPLYFTSTTAGWFAQANRAQREVLARAGAIRLPILGLLPLADSIADPRATEAFWAELGSQDRELVRFEESYHEVLNEVPPLRQRALACIRDFLAARLDARAAEEPGI